MTLNITSDDCNRMKVDRDGVLNEGEQGLDISLGDLIIHFEAESEALMMAEQIAKRLGKEFA